LEMCHTADIKTSLS